MHCQMYNNGMTFVNRECEYTLNRLIADHTSTNLIPNNFIDIGGLNVKNRHIAFRDIFAVILDRLHGFAILNVAM